MEKTSNTEIIKMQYFSALLFICTLGVAGTFVFLKVTETCEKSTSQRYLANNITETVTKENCTNFGY